MALNNTPQQTALEIVFTALNGRMAEVSSEVESGERDWEIGKPTEKEREKVSAHIDKIVSRLATQIGKRLRK